MTHCRKSFTLIVAAFRLFSALGAVFAASGDLDLTFNLVK